MLALRPKVPKPKSVGAKLPKDESGNTLQRGTNSDESKLRQGTAEPENAPAAVEQRENVFNVSFSEAKLGLKLQERGPGLLPYVTALPEGHPQIQIGDQLLAVNEVPLSIHKLPFDLALELLGSSARPVVLWFRRPVPGGDLPPGLSASGIIPTGTLSGEAEFKEAPPNATRNMVNPATTSSSPKQWACPKCTYKNRTYADSCSICTFSRRGADLFCVGDEVTWKGSDAELPAGTVGVVVRKHDDGDVEAFFDQAPGHVSPEDKKLHRIFTMAPNRLDLVLACPSAMPENAQASIAPKRQTDPKQLDELTRDRRPSKGGVEESKSDSAGTDSAAVVAAAVAPSLKSAVTFATTARSKAAVGNATNELNDTQSTSSGAAPSPIVNSSSSSSSTLSFRSSNRTSSSTGRDVFRPVQAPSFLRAPCATPPGRHSKGGELSLGASDEADDVISWSDAGAAVVWHTQVFHCDLFEGHGLALSKSLRVIGVAAGSSAYHAKISAGAYVVKVGGVRVHSLVDFRQCLNVQLAAAFNLEGNVSNGSQPQQQQKQHCQLNMPAPSIPARFYGRSMGHSNSDRRSNRNARVRQSQSAESSRRTESNKAWCDLELKVPHELSSAADPPLIHDVTLLPSAPVAPGVDSPASKKKIAENPSGVEPWAVGDAVCWSKGDNELPNDAIGRVLRLHPDGDVEVFFPTARGDRLVFTFGAEALERVLEVSADEVEVVRTMPTVDNESGGERNRAANLDIRGRSVARKIDALVSWPVRTEAEQHWRVAFAAHAADLARKERGLDSRDEADVQLGRAGFVDLSFELLANASQIEGASSDSKAPSVVDVREAGNGVMNATGHEFIPPDKGDLERAFDLSHKGSNVVNEEEFVVLMSLCRQGAVSGLSEKGFLGFGWGKEVKFKEMLAACTQAQADALFTPVTSDALVNLFEETSSNSERGSVESAKQATSNDSVDIASTSKKKERQDLPWESPEAQGVDVSSSKVPGQRLLVRFESQEETRSTLAQEQRFSSMPRNLPSREDGAPFARTTTASSSLDRYRARSSVDRGTANTRGAPSARPKIGVRPTPPALRPNAAPPSIAPRSPAPDRRPLALSTARYTDGQSSNGSSSKSAGSSSSNNAISSSGKSGIDQSRAPKVAKPGQPKLKRSSLSMRPWRLGKSASKATAAAPGSTKAPTVAAAAAAGANSGPK